MIQGDPGKGGIVQTSLRMPRHVRDGLKIQAIQAGRSYNTHTVMILSQALEGYESNEQNEQDRQGGHPDGL